LLSFSCATIHCSPPKYFLCQFSSTLSLWVHLPFFVFPYLSPYYPSLLQTYHPMITISAVHTPIPLQSMTQALSTTTNELYPNTHIYPIVPIPIPPSHNHPLPALFFVSLFKLLKYLTLSKQLLPFQFPLFIDAITKGFSINPKTGLSLNLWICYC
jgi:hypothetical protein